MKVFSALFFRLLSGDVTSFLMTEARQHNTEIRQSIGKVADKVDQLTSKVFTLRLLRGSTMCHGENISYKGVRIVVLAD